MANSSNLALALKIKALVEGQKNVEALRREVQELAKQAGVKIPDPTNEARDGLDKTKDKALDLRTVLKALATSLLVREFVQANSQVESLNKSLELVSGSTEAAAAEFDFISTEANRLGVEFSTAAKSYLQLAAAAKSTALEGQATRDVWSAVAEAMGRLGKSGADTEGALLAISQMISKGTVAAEEMRLQLGERLPGAMQIGARALGVTTEEFNALLARGEVVADEFLPKLAAELNKTFGGGGEIDTFQANLNRMRNAITNAFVALGNTGLFTALSGALSYLGTALNLAVVGFVILQQRVVVMGKSFAAFVEAVLSLDFSQFNAKVEQAVNDAEKEIQRVSDRVFGADQNLKAAGDSGSKAGDKIADGAAKGSAGVVKLSKDVRELVNELKRSGGGAKDFEDAFTGFFDKSGALQKGQDGMRQLAAFLDEIKKAAPDAGRAVTDGLGKALDKLSAETLDDLRFRAAEIFPTLKDGAEKLAVVNEAVLGASVRKLGLDYDALAGRASAASREAIASFRNIAESAGVSGRAIVSSFDAALSKVKETAGLKELEIGLRNAFNAKQIGLPELETGLERLKLRARELAVATGNGASAYDQLGIKSKESLEIAAEKARLAYEAMVSLGAPIEDQRAGFLAYARTAIEANGGVADSTLKARAASLGLSEEIEKLEKAGAGASGTMRALAAAQDALVRAGQQSAEAIQAENDALLGKMKSEQRALELQGRTTEAALLGVQIAEQEAVAARELAAVKAETAAAAANATAELIRQAEADGVVTAEEQKLVDAAKQTTRQLQESANAAQRDADAKQLMAQATQKATRDLGEISAEIAAITQKMVSDLGELSTKAMNDFVRSINHPELTKATSTLEGLEGQLAKVQARALELQANMRVADFTNFNEAVLGTWLEIANAQIAALQGKIAIEKMVLALNAAEEPAQGLLDKGTQVLRTYSALGEEQLKPLRDALADAERRTQSLRDAARDTLANLRDELDRLRGNEADIQAREFERKQRELQAQLAEARKAGDQSRAADLEESLRLLEQIGAEQRKQREDEARAAEARRREDTGRKSVADAAPPAPANVRQTPPPQTTQRVVERVVSGGGDMIFNFYVQEMDEDTVRRRVIPILEKYRKLNS